MPHRLETLADASRKVVYGDNAGAQPFDSVKEIAEKSADINYQFGGDYVWLRSQLTGDAQKGATGFQVVLSKDPIAGQFDLASGAGGDYRYLIPTFGEEGKPHATELALYRTSWSVSTPPPGYYGMTEDINVHRGKTYLYLVWKA
ncbi:hypothetical protein AURDEDRAFT_65289 [Auricularia subglabra TFB-10046 SS5]|nr:hypothetical protein AURDEDRAFT_65289 [Auricularia subglabra TFB-10046 SS5]